MQNTVRMMKSSLKPHCCKTRNAVNAVNAADAAAAAAAAEQLTMLVGMPLCPQPVTVP